MMILVQVFPSRKLRDSCRTRFVVTVAEASQEVTCRIKYSRRLAKNYEATGDMRRRRKRGPGNSATPLHEYRQAHT